jgi:hypothetical protein
MAGRHRNPLPPSYPRAAAAAAGNHLPPPLHPHLPPHHPLDDYRDPPRLPPHHHIDDFRDPSRLPPGHPDSFQEPPPPHLRHFVGHGHGGAGGPLPPQPHVVAALEERLGAEIDEAHALLAQNQRLAATHVALVQEVAAARHELGRTANALTSAQEESDLRLREVRTLSLYIHFYALQIRALIWKQLAQIESATEAIQIPGGSYMFVCLVSIHS